MSDVSGVTGGRGSYRRSLAESIHKGEYTCSDLTPNGIESNLKLLIEGRAQKIERASQPEQSALDPKPPGYIDDSDMYRALRALGKATTFRASSFRVEHLDSFLSFIHEPPLRHADISFAAAVATLAEERPELFRRDHLDYLLSVAPLEPDLVDDALGFLANKRGELWRADDVLNLVPFGSEPGIAKVIDRSLGSLCGAEWGEIPPPPRISCSLATTVQEMLRSSIPQDPDILPLLSRLDFTYTTESNTYDVDAIVALAEAGEVKALPVLDHVVSRSDRPAITMQHVDRIALLTGEHAEAYAPLKTIALSHSHLISNTVASFLLKQVPQRRDAVEILKILVEKREWFPKRHEFSQLFEVARSDPSTAALVRSIAFQQLDFFSGDDLPFLLDPDAPSDFLVIVSILAKDRPHFFDDISLNRILLRIRSEKNPLICERLAMIVDELALRTPDRFLNDGPLLQRVGSLVGKQKQLAGTLVRLAGILTEEQLPLKRELERYIKTEIATHMDVASYFLDEAERNRWRTSELFPLLRQANPTSSRTSTYFFNRYKESEGILLSVERRRLAEMVRLSGEGSRYAAERLKPIIAPPLWRYENERVEPYLRIPPRSFEVITKEESDLFDQLLDAAAKNHHVLEVIEEVVAVHELLGEGEGIRGKVIDGLIDRALKPVDGSGDREAARALALYLEKNLGEIDRPRLERLLQVAREKIEIGPGLARLLKARPEDASFLAKALIEAGQGSEEGATCLLMVVIEEPFSFRDPKFIDILIRYFEKSNETLSVTALTEMAEQVREAFHERHIFVLSRMMAHRPMAMMLLSKLIKTRPELFTPHIAGRIVKGVKERRDGELIFDEGDHQVNVGDDLVAQLVSLHPSLQRVVQRYAQMNRSVSDPEPEADPCPETKVARLGSLR